MHDPRCNYITHGLVLSIQEIVWLIGCDELLQVL
jgi:hypothetical protein